MRVLALDVGSIRIGLAVSDPMGIIASPLVTYVRAGLRRDVAEVLRIAEEQGAERILVGVPISMDGVPRQQAIETLQFVDALKERTSLRVVTVDERLSTVEAERRMRETGLSSGRRRALRDAAAAAVLLQSYLDSQAMRGAGGQPSEG